MVEEEQARDAYNFADSICPHTSMRIHVRLGENQACYLIIL